MLSLLICICCILIVFISYRWQSPYRLCTQRVTGQRKLTGGCTGTQGMLFHSKAVRSLQSPFFELPRIKSSMFIAHSVLVF